MTTNARQMPGSTIGRPVDLSYPTNRAIALIALALLLIGGIVAAIQGQSWGQAGLQGLSWAGTAFLAWALCRETDPDRSMSAFIAAAGALVGTILLGTPSFLLLFWFLLGMRLVNRSTGLAPTILDIIGLIGLTLWLGWSIHWTIPVLMLPVLGFASLDRFPKVVRMLLLLAPPTAALVLGFVQNWQWVLPIWGWGWIAGGGAIALAMIPVIVSYRRVQSVGDNTGQPLHPGRVQASLVWILCVALWLAGAGIATPQELAPVWAALAGTVIGWMITRLRG